MAGRPRGSLRLGGRARPSGISGWLRSASLCLTSLLPACAPAPQAAQWDYPETRQVEQSDRLHGVEVLDPYRWLEGDPRDSAEIAHWVARQNHLTRSYLDGISERAAIAARIRRLRDYEKLTPPVRAGGRYYYLGNDGLQPFNVVYRMDSLTAEPSVLLDPNQWSADGSLALDGYAFSNDGRYVAYGVVEGGSDWRSWRVKEIESGRVLEDELRWVRYFGVAWTANSQGFFYSRFEAPGSDSGSTEAQRQRLYYHRINSPQSEDALVYERPDEPGWLFQPEVTDDGRYLVVTVFRGAERRLRILCWDLEQPESEPTSLVDRFENDYTLVGSEGERLFFLTDLEAPLRRLVSADLAAPKDSRWREIVPQGDEPLQAIDRVGDRFIAIYLHDVRSRVQTYTLAGEPAEEIELPGIGTAFGFAGRQDDHETFFYFSNMATPASVYRYDLATATTSLFRQSETDFEPRDYVVRQVFYGSADGTRIPMFLAHKRGLRLDGHNPTLLYGYGGFGSSMTPSFQASRLAWMEMGGVFALANIRGGGEYGEAWHQAGTRLGRHKVFEDFIAAAEYLIATGYTAPRKLAIEGRSGGGLLVGAVLVQRPELFAAALVEYGVLDALRFQLFGAGKFWVDELGSVDDPDEFTALAAYSPYHNVKDGVRYPATLVATADTDERVPPLHSFKFAAALQRAQAAADPILLRVQTSAGHGAGTPTEERIAFEADLWAFLVRNLDMQVSATPE
jgi:prolyl oligopeptidase